MILTRLKAQKKKIEFNIEIISEFIFLIMQMLMTLFVDGGIINGTLNNVSPENIIQF